MSKLQFEYSRISSDSLREIVINQYAVSNDINCNYFVTGLHDNYLVKDLNKKYLLRIYRNSWRNLDEIRFELELLLYINSKDSDHPTVAAPLLSKKLDYCITIDCPDGIRYAALFPYIEGIAPQLDITESQSLLLGKTIATIHQQSIGFNTQYHRNRLDLDYLLDQSVNQILPMLSEKQKLQLIEIQTELHYNIPQIPFENPSACFCSGDVNNTNFHINNNKITVFDFDQCGYGLRCFEIAKYYSSLLNLNDLDKLNNIQKSFLSGYQSVTELEPNELIAIPYFVCVSLIWVMAIHVDNINLIGSKYLDMSFWNRRMTNLINSLPS